MAWDRIVGSLLLAFAFVAPATAEEISLYSSDGSAVAYIDVDDEMTVYLWEGRAVAYLERRDASTFDVWGFNGKHIGWFANGAIWDNSGNASCALREALAFPPKFEPFKSFKQFKNFKSFKKLAPLEPLHSGHFGAIPCSLALAVGGN